MTKAERVAATVDGWIECSNCDAKFGWVYEFSIHRCEPIEEEE